MTPRERAETLWEALQPPKFKQKPTLEGLEAILNGPDRHVEILPSGEIIVDGIVGGKEAAISTIEAAITEHVHELLADDEAEAIICAVGVKHQLNIHPAIARDIAATLLRKAGV